MRNEVSILNIYNAEIFILFSIGIGSLQEKIIEVCDTIIVVL